MKRNERGITLIALIITVIVLLILAGTAVSIAINGGDIFTRANEAKTSWNSAVSTEESEINNALAILDQLLPSEASKQWEFAENGDKDSSGTLTVGDLIRPTIAAVASEQFYVIGIDGTGDNQIVKLIAKKCVDPTDSVNKQSTSQAALTGVPFDQYEQLTNEYAQSDTIKGKVEAYANWINEFLTLENVEIVEGGNAVNGIKGRLIWETEYNFFANHISEQQYPGRRSR